MTLIPIPTPSQAVVDSKGLATEPWYKFLAQLGRLDFFARTVGGTAVTYAKLPTVPIEGMLVAVTDSNTATWGATIVGGSTNNVLAFYNGSAWTVAGK